MPGMMPVGAVLAHPRGNVLGNVRWPGSLPAAHLPALGEAITSIRTLGYFCSAFPEGDGLCFKRKDGQIYDPEAALIDFHTAFPFLALEAVEAHGLSGALARLSKDRVVSCTYVVPVEGLRLEAPFQLGATRFHAPVNGEEITLANHAWRELCEVPGADVTAGWAPTGRASGTTELLAHPLIERTINIPLAALYEAGASFDSQSIPLRLIMEDADHALDSVRFDLCHFHRLHHLPAKPGWVGEFALAYVVPEEPSLKPQFIAAKPYVLRVSNNWLGLEVDAGSMGMAEPLADLIVDNASDDEITLALRAALRAWNRAFYLVELEASFLHLIYAIDALCDPGRLRETRHRLWITAFMSGGDAAAFSGRLEQFETLYEVRNRIVHSGESFASLALAGEEQCDFMLDVLGDCIRTFLMNGFATRRSAAEFAFAKLSSTNLASLFNPGKVTLPLTTDKVFGKHMAAWT